MSGEHECDRGRAGPVKAKSAQRVHPPPPRPVRSRAFKRYPRRRSGDWVESTPSREHLPVAQRMEESIVISSTLSKLPIIGREQQEDVLRMVPGDLIPVLRQADVDFVLAGAHGLGGWMVQSRATQDVDFIIRIKDSSRAADAILKKFPRFELQKNPEVWRFGQDGQWLVDLILTRAPLFKRVINEYKEIHINKRLVKVPNLEAALAMKFASMVGHYRPGLKKMQDAVDFSSLLQANKVVDLKLLRELGELVFSGGGDNLLQCVEDVRAGRTLEI